MYLKEDEDCTVVTSDDVRDEGDVANDVEDDDNDADDDDDGEDNDGDGEYDKNGTFASFNVPGESVESGDEVICSSLVFNGCEVDSFVEVDETTCTRGDDVISSGFLVDCTDLADTPTDDTVALGDSEIANESSTSTSLLLLSGDDNDDDDRESVVPFVSSGAFWSLLSSFELAMV